VKTANKEKVSVNRIGAEKSPVKTQSVKHTIQKDTPKCIIQNTSGCGEKPICKNCFGEIVPDNSKLIGDHIIPIAIGGEEYDLENVQTLCIKCNKIKTKEDIKKIALYRRQDKHQSKLNDGNDGIPPKPKDLGILPTIT
jgi:5-methylcytosine-specific restriction endonuclease McrA